MLGDAFRNLRGRVSRTCFTVAGISIGILALVVVGSLAERLHEIVARSTALNAGLLFAAIDRSLLGRSDAPVAVRRIGTSLALTGGVASVVPEVVLPYRVEGNESGRLGPPSLIFGFPDDARSGGTKLGLREGREASSGERRVAVVGADFAATEPVRPHDIIALYGNSYEVIGIYAKSFTLFDQAIVIPLGDAQRLLMQRVSPTASFLPRAGITAFLVTLKPNADPGLVAARINTIPSVTARDPAELVNAVRSTLSIFDAIVFGAALIALLIGAFSIVNTMTIAVTERTHEIGIRKAIGATDGDILREFLIEAGTIGALGGFAGIALGALVVTYLDTRSIAGGNLELFSLSPRVAAGSFALAIVLSIAAGLVPAFAASRLPPTEALRRP